MDAPIHWLLTYLLHSTLLLGGVALLRLALGERRLALQEALLRAAIVGGFLTASLQIALDLRPLGGSLAVPLPAATRAEPAAPTQGRAALVLPAIVAVESPVMAPLEADGTDPRPLPAASAPAWTSMLQRSWRIVLAVSWGGLALLGLARLASSALRLRGLLRGRRPLADDEVAPGMRATAQNLGLSRRVRLSAAPRLKVPLATGIVRPEVCLPTRALADLAADERMALCAHELAHVARRDPLWLLIAHLAETVAPFQPLNRWARRRLASISECLSDDLAVSASAQPLGLARSLVDVASWTVGERPACPATAAGALSARSRLAYRVERLMDPLRHPERPRRFLLPLAGLVVLATALVTPVVSGRAAAGPEPVTPPVAPAEVVEPVPALPPDPPEPAALPEPPAGAEVAVPPAHATIPHPPKPAAHPVPMPHPAPRPHPAPIPHAAPRPHPAPPALPHLDQELEHLSERIGERMHDREAEMQKLQAEIDALGTSFKPDEAEIARLSEEIGKAAGELAELSIEGAEKADPNRPEKRAEAARRVAELRAQIREVAGRMRFPKERLGALRDKAHALAEMARPNPEELRELSRLSSDLARETLPHASEMAREAAEHAREAAERARREQKRAFRGAGDQSKAELERAQQELAEQARDAMAQAERAMREAEDQMRRAREQMSAARKQMRQATPRSKSRGATLLPATFVAISGGR